MLAPRVFGQLMRPNSLPTVAGTLLLAGETNLTFGYHGDWEINVKE